MAVDLSQVVEGSTWFTHDGTALTFRRYNPSSLNRYKYEFVRRLANGSTQVWTYTQDGKFDVFESDTSKDISCSEAYRLLGAVETAAKKLQEVVASALDDERSLDFSRGSADYDEVFKPMRELKIALQQLQQSRDIACPVDSLEE